MKLSFQNLPIVIYLRHFVNFPNNGHQTVLAYSITFMEWKKSITGIHMQYLY